MDPKIAGKKTPKNKRDAFGSERRLSVSDSGAPLKEQDEAAEGPNPERGIILWWHIQGRLSKCPHVPPSVTLPQSKLSVCLYMPFDCIRHPSMHTHTHPRTHLRTHQKLPRGQLVQTRGLSNKGC